MKTSLRILSCAALVLACTTPFVLISAKSDSPAPQGPPAGKPEKPDKPEKKEKGGGGLDGDMQQMQGDMKKVDKALGGDKKDLAAALAPIMDMEKAAQEAKLGTPEKAGELSDKTAKEDFVKGFRTQMIQLQKALLDTEAALIGGKGDEAAKAWDQVKAARKMGHDKFKGN